MITKLLVIQKINENGNVDVYQTASDNFQWTFETDAPNVDKSMDCFPFSIMGNPHTVKRAAGRETRTEILENQILFFDDYGVPEGTVVGILFPKNYIPDVLKFKDKPYIPVGAGQIITRPPGQIQLLYNQIEKRAAIVLHIHDRLLFGIKCLAKKVPDDQFPSNSNWLNDDFDITISRELLQIDTIKTEDLRFINEAISKVDLEDVNTTLNEILSALKSGEKDKAKFSIGKLGKKVASGLAMTSNLVKLADSYHDGGAAHKFITQIIKYADL